MYQKILKKGTYVPQLLNLQLEKPFLTNKRSSKGYQVRRMVNQMDQRIQKKI